MHTPAHPTARHGMRPWSQRWGVTAAGLVMAACGGSSLTDVGSLYPLWIPTSVTVADLDGNGWPDIITSAYVSPSLGVFEGRVKVWRQSSDGVFSAAEEYAVGQTPWALRVHDIDGDGRGDLVVGEPEQTWDALSRPGRVWWLRQDPVLAGRFLPAVTIGEGYNVYDLDVADLTGDHLPDIALGDARAGSNHVLILPQNALPRGSFGPALLVPTPGPVSRVSARDIDGDGLLDLATAYTSALRDDYSYDTSLGLNLGGPVGFGNTLTLTGFAYGSAAFLGVADFNFDGRTDVVAYFNRLDERATPTIRLLPQVGTNTWGSAIDTLLPVDVVRGRDGQTTTDLNGDGKIDFVLVGTYPEGTSPDGVSIVRSDMSLFIQAADGHFTRSTAQPLPVLAKRVGAGDLDQNGRQDLVVYGTNPLLSGGERDQLLVLRQSATGTFPTALTLP